MRLFVGLGNPGREHSRQRHNIGFMAVERIAAEHGFGPWRAKFQGQVCDGRLGEVRVTLLKPETYMNLSGQSVAAAARFLKIETPAIDVFHDELDLAPGKLRLKRGGGHAGHNGLRDIMRHLGPEFRRVRMGIGHPGDKARVSGYVLHDFTKYEEGWLDDMLRGVAEGAPKLAADDEAGFQNAVALRLAPPRPPKAPRPPKPAAAASAPEAPPDATPDPAPAPAPAESLLDKLRRRFS